MPNNVKLNAEGVVKPLVWKPSQSGFIDGFAAEGLSGKYTCYPGMWINGWTWSPPHSEDYFISPDEDQAKAAAQADYEQRILSCLTPEALASLDNSKPTPAVGDDGQVAAWRVRQRIFELKNKWSGWFVSEDRPEWGDGSDVEYQPLVPASSLAALTKEIAFWQVDDAAAWDKCEEQRIAEEKLEAALAAAHSQHEADVARIAELTQTLQRIFNVLTFPVDSSISPRRWHPHISDPNGSVEYVAEIAEAALANRKETK